MRPKKRTVWRRTAPGRGLTAHGRLRRRIPAEMKMKAVLRDQRSAAERHPAGITSEMMAGAIMNVNGYQTGRSTDHRELQSKNYPEQKSSRPDVRVF